MSRRVYDDHTLAIPHHAVERLRERVGLMHIDDDECRWLIRRAIDDNPEEPHYVMGQTVVPVTVLGTTVYAVLTKDESAWSKGKGKAVLTVLTQEQLDRSWQDRS